MNLLGLPVWVFQAFGALVGFAFAWGALRTETKALMKSHEKMTGGLESDRRVVQQLSTDIAVLKERFDGFIRSFDSFVAGRESVRRRTVDKRRRAR